MTEFQRKELTALPVLKEEEGQCYIYVLLNHPDGNIKIGRTTNLEQRIQSLSGSNGAGNKIIRWFCSPPTYLYTIERACQNHFHYASIPNSEWFNGTKITFEQVQNYLKGLFLSTDYALCNELRMMSNFDKKGGIDEEHVEQSERFLSR